MSGEVKHTPGPWELTNGDHIWGISAWNARVLLARVHSHSPMNGIDSKANAALMTAAPEMYEALLAAEDKAQRGALNMTADELERVKTLRRAALAKAEGRA